MSTPHATQRWGGTAWSPVIRQLQPIGPCYGTASRSRCPSSSFAFLRARRSLWLTTLGTVFASGAVRAFSATEVKAVAKVVSHKERRALKKAKKEEEERRLMEAVPEHDRDLSAEAVEPPVTTQCYSTSGLGGSSTSVAEKTRTAHKANAVGKTMSHKERRALKKAK